jgi:hypothetical protein
MALIAKGFLPSVSPFDFKNEIDGFTSGKSSYHSAIRLNLKT